MSETLTPQLDDTINSEFSSDVDDLLIVAPTHQLLSSIITARFEKSELPALDVIAPKSSIKSAINEFVIASKAAALVEEEVLELRILQSTVGNSLFISEKTVVSIVRTTDGISAISTANESAVNEIKTNYRAKFGGAETYVIRTPSLTHILETLERDFTESLRDDFKCVLNTVESIYRSPDTIDATTIMILLAAKHELLQYDLSIWGEDTNFASRGRVSQIKSELEEQGFIQSEKVSGDIGRPRLQLYLTDRLAGKPADALIEDFIQKH